LTLGIFLKLFPAITSIIFIYILLRYIFFHKILGIAYTIYSLDPASRYTHVVFPSSNPEEYTFPKVTCNFYQNVWLVRIWNIFDFEIQAFDLYTCNCEDYHNHPLELPHHFYFWFRCQRIFAVGSYNTMLLFSFCIILIVLFQIGEHHNYYLLIKITSSSHISL